MKKIIISVLLTLIFFSLRSQVSGEDKLLDLENSGEKGTTAKTAITTTSTRLFRSMDDLASVILIIPKGSIVTVLGDDSTSMIVSYEGNTGYIRSNHAEMNREPVTVSEPVSKQESPENKVTVSETKQKPAGRLAYLESKYGPTMAARLYEGKIWKGMNSDMVKDSWGKADQINREVNDNTIKEEWIYKNTWLFLENNILVQWGPVK